MTNENQQTEVKNNCLCQNECFKKIFVIATGSFIGVFCALSLFAALHRPPIPCPAAFHMPPAGPSVESKFQRPPHHFYKHHKHFHERPFEEIQQNEPIKK